MVRSGSIFARYPVSPFYAGRHANDKRKRQSIIVPHPGAGRCRPGALSDAEVVRGVACETARYLGKAFGDGWDLDGRETNWVNRSKHWLR